MFDIAQVVLFILACAFLFSLTLFLFRDQITSSRRSAERLTYSGPVCVRAAPSTGAKSAG